MPIYRLMGGIKMRVEGINKVNSYERPEDIKVYKTNPAGKDGDTSGAVFEKTEEKDQGHVYDKATIDSLKKASEKSHDSLRRIVANLLRRQGKASNLFGSDDMVDIDAATRAEASELIGPSGSLGVEAVSDSIFDFAIAVSGGDKSKLETLKNAIDKGFREAERILGGLPQISLDTYDRIMDKLDNWEKEN